MAHNTEYLLTKSETFCMFPWIHFMATPPGDVFPCCVGVTETPMTKITPTSNFETIINSDNFKKLRRDMLSETKNSICVQCYNTEKFNNGSWRSFGNNIFGSFIDEVLPNTKEDGTLENFKMRYYDIRFNNICNFKCRMCGPDYSTLWTQEENSRIKPYQIPVHNLSKTTKILSEFLSHVDDVEFVYFAGGEPLITEEHYIILEELIRKNRTNVKIRYNTNCSVLSYKDKNIFDLWKHFDHIDVSASIDHIGERAEYIRTGTDWGVVETNLQKFHSTDNVILSVNTVLSIYNYTTLPLLYDYLIDFGIVANNSLICTPTPEYFSATVLPKILKEQCLPNNLKLIEKMKSLNVNCNQIETAIKFTQSSDDWEAQKENFLKETLLRDSLRNDSFEKSFPELKIMMDTTL